MIRFNDFNHLFSEQAKSFPDFPALIFEEEGTRKSLSYRQLYDTLIRRSEILRAAGASCLALLCSGSAACLLEFFSAVLAGMQVVLLDENLPEEQLSRQITASDADMLWTEDEDLRRALSFALTKGAAEPEDKVLFFTSGTTRSAQAVVLTQQSLCASAWNGSSLLPLSPGERLLCVLPFHHVFGMVCGVLWGFACGSSVCLGRGPRHYHDDCAAFRPTAVSLVPMLLGFMEKYNLFNPELKLILVGAGDCPQSYLDAAASLGIRVSFGYGLTETSSGLALSLGSDPRAMTICPDASVTFDTDGEILVRNDACMMQGYYKNPELTAAVLSGGVLRTGDVGYLDTGGHLHITGRKKEILVLGDGTKIYLPEYEQQLQHVLHGRDYAVTLISGAPALIVQATLDEVPEIRENILPFMKTLPRGQQISRIEITSLPLPRTATGKLKRWMISERYNRPEENEAEQAENTQKNR